MEELGEGVDPEIAAAMGFSSFGSKAKNKRRRPDFDEELSAATRVGKSPKIGPTSDGSRGEEILESAPSSTVAQDPTADQAMTSSTADEVEPRESIYQRIPDTPNKAMPTQRKQHPAPGGLAAFLQRGLALPDGPDLSAEQTTENVAESAVPPLELPKSILEKSLEELSPQDLGVLARGVPNEIGDVVYFQMNFLEDPWEKLRSRT